MSSTFETTAINPNNTFIFKWDERKMILLKNTILRLTKDLKTLLHVLVLNQP